MKAENWFQLRIAGVTKPGPKTGRSQLRSQRALVMLSNEICSRVAMRVERDFQSARAKLALERLLEGHALQFERLSISLGPEGQTVVSVASHWRAENLNEALAEGEIGSARNRFGELLAAWPELGSALRSRQVTFELVDDYGTGTVLICTRRDDGSLQWSS